MTIYLINETYVDGEDYYSRDTYADRILEDAGYFTTREDAQAFIDQAIADSEVKHQEKVKGWEKARDEQQKRRDEIMAVYDTLVEEIKKKGYAEDSLKKPVLPGDPSHPVYVKPDLTIIEMEEHSGA